MRYFNNSKHVALPLLIVVGISHSCIHTKRIDAKEQIVSVESICVQKADTLLVAEIDVNKLIITEVEYARRRCYFLFDKEHRIVDSVEFSTYREVVLNREIYDWNGDGVQDIVETHKYQGQMFSSITDVVYSVTNNKFRRIFSIDTHELDCTTTNENNWGIIIRREYEQIESNVFRVSEVKGYVKCGDDPDIPDKATPFKIIDRKQYDVTADELLNMYGEQYDR